MIVTRLKIPLEQREYSALIQAAIGELRDAESQARFLIRCELERQGYLEPLPAANQRNREETVFESSKRA